MSEKEPLHVIKVEHTHPYRYDEDGFTVTRGNAWSAPGCHLGCGVIMYSDGDKLVKVEGDPEHPYNQGRLCVRCLAVPEAVNSPDRLLYPLKRSRENRGKNVFERITWDEALDTIEERFKYYKENFGAESVQFWQGTGRDIAAWISRLAWSFGSPNYTFNINAHSCYSPRIFACSFTTGTFWVGDYSQQFADRFDNPEWKCPDVTLVWGNEPLAANSDGAYGHWVLDVLERGSKLIVVDPRLTWLAAKADIWLQLRPGTDCAVALGMANYVIKEDLYDHEFVDMWCYGFDEFAEHVGEWTPERTEEVTGVAAEKIAAAARLYAQADAGLVQWGVALDQRIDNLENGRAIVCLMALTGNFDKPGTMIQPPELLKYITGWGREWLTPEQDEKRLGANYHPAVRVGSGAAGSSDCIEALLTGKPYPIKAVWMQSINSLACGGADTEVTMKAFNNSEFNVVADLFMTPTAMAFADIVLPIAMFPERNGIRCGDGCQRGETINQAVSPAGECRSDMEVNLELGRRFNPEAWPWENVEQMFSSIVEETGYTFEELRDVAPAYLPFEYGLHEKGKLRKDGGVGFPTTTGRIELWSHAFNNIGMDPMPTYYEQDNSPMSAPELCEEFPYILSTGARQWGYFHSEHRQVPHLRALHPEPTVQINPEDLADLGFEEGQWVWLEGPIGRTGRTGRCKRKVEAYPGMARGVMCTEHGWWHPEGDPEKLYDALELNCNNLITWDYGTTGWGANHKALACRVYPVKDGE